MIISQSTQSIAGFVIGATGASYIASVASDGSMLDTSVTIAALSSLVYAVIQLWRANNQERKDHLTAIEMMRKTYETNSNALNRELRDQLVKQIERIDLIMSRMDQPPSS